LVTLSGDWTAAKDKNLIKSGSSAFPITQDASKVDTTTINGGTLALGGSGSLGLFELRGGVLATSGTFAGAQGDRGHLDSGQ